MNISKTIVAACLITAFALAHGGRAGAQVPVYDFDGFEHLLHQKNDTVYVINFWATWCVPCVKELPEFEKINANYQNRNVSVLLVSLDMSRDYEKRLLPFIEKHDLKSKVVMLDDPRSNRWIPKVSEDWSGAIPATVIYRNDKRAFYERTFTYEELENELLNFLNK
jgi:thiol-disulfide isomerase/thioredoxin